jgi:hypothetical protein
MPSLGALMPKTLTMTLDLGGDDTAKITYDPNQLVYLDQANADTLPDESSPDTPENRNLMARQLAGAVVGWDLEGPLPPIDLHAAGIAAGSVVPEGAVIPVDPDILTYFSVPALVQIYLAISEHAREFPKLRANGSRGPGKTGTST